MDSALRLITGQFCTQQSWRAARPQPACADGSPENFSSTSFAESTMIGSSLLSGRRTCASLQKLRGESFQESRRQARARPRRARHDFVKKCRHMGREFQVMTSCLTLFLTLFLRKRPGKVKSAAPSSTWYCIHCYIIATVTTVEYC